MKTFVALAAGALLALAFVGVGAAGHAKSAGLVGEVGPGFSIEVKKAGKDLKTIKHGTYTINPSGVAPKTSDGTCDTSSNATPGQAHVTVRLRGPLTLNPGS